MGSDYHSPSGSNTRGIFLSKIGFLLSLNLELFTLRGEEEVFDIS